MPFKVIPGTYRVVGFSPDGDSIRFKPDNPEQLLTLQDKPLDLEKKLDRPVQLRIEAIDTLETHYQLKSGGTVHQPVAHAHSARSGLLEFVGITNVQWGADGKVTSAKDGTRGYILARAFEKNGRVVAFVFAGTPPQKDDIVLKAPLLRDSFNFAAIERGLAYPTFYHGLFADLRKELAQAAAAARKARRGVYADDDTGAGFAVNSMTDLTDRHVIMPKLFRRLAEYVAQAGSAAGFKAVLETAREPVLDLRNDANFTHFDTFVVETGTTIRLDRHPEEMVFDPRVPSSTEKIAGMMAARSAPGTDTLPVTVPIVDSASVAAV